MKTFLTAHWKTIVIGVLLILIGVILARSCGKSKPESKSQAVIDSVTNQNTDLQAKSVRFSDSVKAVISKKDERITELTKSLNLITYKYALKIKNLPNVDTVIKTHTVYLGQEAMEKVPILQMKLKTCESVNIDLQNMYDRKENDFCELQGQFVVVKEIATSEVKKNEKLEKKIKRKNKVIAGVSIIGLGFLIYGIAK